MSILRTCAYCEQPAEGEYSIHAYAVGEGPEVDLCNHCGSGEYPTCDQIWQAIRNREQAQAERRLLLGRLAASRQSCPGEHPHTALLRESVAYLTGDLRDRVERALQS